MWVGDGTVLRYGAVYKVIMLDVPPMIVDGRTLVPVRGVVEISDCDVQWDGAAQTVTITSHKEN